MQHCFFPPVPFHIREKRRAAEAVRQLVRPRRYPGISHTLGYWATVNHAEACIRSALRAHRGMVA